MSKCKAITFELDKQFKNIYRDNRQGKTYRQQLNQFEKWLIENGHKRITVEESKQYAKQYIKEKSEKVSNISVNAAVSMLIKIYKNTDGLTVDRTYLEYKKQTIAPTKGRETHIDRQGNEYHGARPDKAEAARLIEFAKMVGIRENEYKYLKGNNIQEINGKTYVIVEHGKGNKYQWQLIAPENVAKVRSYFDGTNNRVFTNEEIKSVEQSNLHYYRRTHAQEMYKYYESLQGVDREALKALVQEQFRRGELHDIAKYGTDKNGKSKHKIWDKYLKYAAIADIPYKTRNKDGIVYDRVALMAMSCLHLSHWRTDVTVSNYMR